MDTNQEDKIMKIPPEFTSRSATFILSNIADMTWWYEHERGFFIIDYIPDNEPHLTVCLEAYPNKFEGIIRIAEMIKEGWTLEQWDFSNFAGQYGKAQFKAAIMGEYPCYDCEDTKVIDKTCAYDSECAAWKIYITLAKPEE